MIKILRICNTFIPSENKKRDVISSLFFQRDKGNVFCEQSKRQSTVKNKSIFFIILLLFLFSLNSYGQCSFVGGTAFGSTQICYDSNRPAQFTNVPLGSYVSVNVIEGLSYTISMFNYDSSYKKRISIYDSNNTGTTLTYNDAVVNQDQAVINWTAAFTGTVHIQYNDASNCFLKGGKTVAIKVMNTGGSNTADLQTAAGTNSWIGHIYDFAQSVGVPPADNDTFANYLGYFLQPNTVSGSTNSFVQYYGGSDFCFPFTAAGISQTVRTDSFAVRYRMNTTPSVYPAGCYMVKIVGDDGVRLYVDGILVFDAWKIQAANTYENILIHFKR